MEGRAPGAKAEGTLDAMGVAGPAISAVWGHCPQARSQSSGIPATKTLRVFGAVSSRFALSSGLGLCTRLLGIRMACNATPPGLCSPLGSGGPARDHVWLPWTVNEKLAETSG